MYQLFYAGDWIWYLQFLQILFWWAVDGCVFVSWALLDSQLWFCCSADNDAVYSCGDWSQSALQEEFTEVAKLPILHILMVVMPQWTIFFICSNKWYDCSVSIFIDVNDCSVSIFIDMSVDYCYLPMTEEFVCMIVMNWIINILLWVVCKSQIFMILQFK